MRPDYHPDLQIAFPDQTLDLYGKAELDEILRHNIEQGLFSNPEDQQDSSLGNLATQISQETNKLTGYDAEAIDWGTDQLAHAMLCWANYPEEIVGPLIRGFEEDGQLDPELAPTIKRLYEAKIDLINSGEQTVDGINVGWTMDLVLMPWQQILNNLDRFPQWVAELREAQKAQGITIEADEMYPIANYISLNSRIYRDTLIPDRRLTAREYLDKKIQQDGAWGIMLVQTSPNAGIQHKQMETPATLTWNGHRNYTIGDHAVDRLGIFEYLSLTLQEDVTTLPPNSRTWLLANRDFDNRVPWVMWSAQHHVQDWTAVLATFPNVNSRLAVS